MLEVALPCIYLLHTVSIIISFSWPHSCKSSASAGGPRPRVVQRLVLAHGIDVVQESTLEVEFLNSQSLA